VAAALLELERDQAIARLPKTGAQIGQESQLRPALASDDAAISQAAWQSLATWHEAAEDYQQAANCYRRAMEERAQLKAVTQ